MIDIQQLKKESLLADIQSDFSVFWVLTDKIPSSVCIHNQDSKPLIFINLREAIYGLEKFEDIINWLQLHYLHELLHAFAGPESGLQEIYFSALCKELLNFDVERSLMIKKGFLKRVFVEEHPFGLG
jgi:hypothetical protein